MSAHKAIEPAACHGKIQYVKHADAAEVMERMRVAGKFGKGTTAHVYKCSFCHAYHIGRS